MSEEIVKNTKNLPTTVTFQNVEMEIRDHDGDRWVTSVETANALGYTRPDILGKLIRNNPKSFEGRTCNTTVVWQGQRREMVLLNFSGVIMAAMMSQTDLADDFRIWAVDVLLEVMITGRYDVREHLLTAQDECHRDINILRNLAAESPEKINWVYKSIHNRWLRYEATQMVPRPYVTELTPEWFKQTYGAEQWSKDTVVEMWPELAKAKDFEKYRQSCGVPKHNGYPIDQKAAFAIYRDQEQFGMSVSSLLKKYKIYSRDSIQKALRNIDKYVIKGLQNNERYDIDRYSSQIYIDEYLNSDGWDNKRHIMLYPTGPYNLCWECLRPISLVTGSLHHLTYDRLGHEIKDDLEPVCSVCHAYLHPKKSGVKGDNPNKVVTLKNVRVIRQNSTGKSMSCDIGGESKLVPHFAIQNISEITKNAQPGDRGTLVMSADIAKQNGIRIFTILSEECPQF